MHSPGTLIIALFALLLAPIVNALALSSVTLFYTPTVYVTVTAPPAAVVTTMLTVTVTAGRK